MKVEKILNIALDLCGLRDGTGGIPASCDDMIQRTPSLLCTIAAEYAFIDKAAGNKSAGNKSADAPTDLTLDSEISLSDGLCMTVIPYLLAASLIEDEDSALAATFRRLADTALRHFEHAKARTHEIKEIY